MCTVGGGQSLDSDRDRGDYRNTDCKKGFPSLITSGVICQHLGALPQARLSMKLLSSSCVWLVLFSVIVGRPKKALRAYFVILKKNIFYI